MDTDSSSVPRALVPQAVHSAIDAILKDLKICSRRIHHALDTHADEVRLLHRVYYKSKNQHRGALFWRRLVEMRRYSERLDKANILSTVEEIRASFFGAEAKQNLKYLKGPWTHSPHKNIVEKAFDHLQVCRALLQKMQERVLEAYRSFTLAMQSGAFVQLLVVLAGMASRIRTVSIDIDENLCTTSSSLKQFLSLDTKTLNLALPKDPDNVLTFPVYDEIAKTQVNKPSPSEPVVQIVSRIRKKRPIPAGKWEEKKLRKTRDEIDEIFSSK